MRRQTKTWVLATSVILLFGMARVRFEQKLSDEHRAAYFNTAKLDLDLRQKLTQMGFLAALSGFRSVVADVLWIQAHSAWERVEWGRMKLLFETVTSLQPRALMFWEISSWHMAYNASIAALEDNTQPREALRIKAQREYFKVGEDFLLRGIQNNPDRALLYDRLGMLYRDKFQDHVRSFEAYDKGARLPDAAQYVARFAAYELSQVPGREREAYDRLSAMFRDGKNQHLPTLIRRLSELEEKLDVPQAQRIPIPQGSK